MMATQYFCENEKRHNAARQHPTMNGIDYLEVLDSDYNLIFPDEADAALRDSLRQRILIVRLLKSVPSSLDRDNIHLQGGVRLAPVEVLWAQSVAYLLDNDVDPALSGEELDYLGALDEPENVLVVRTSSPGDYSRYKLSITSGPFESDPFVNFDAQLSEVTFSFKVECPSDFDCAPADDCPVPEPAEEPLIDYLTKDYASFRRLMLDRLSVTLPDWAERSPADVGIALVELMAYAADYLSYYQDAVATEAYLGTARKRVSMRRHARLLDYPMHDGRNARAWVHVEVSAADVLLPKGTPMITKSEKLGPTIPHELPPIDPQEEIGLSVTKGAKVFETMENAVFFDAHNTIDFYTWMDSDCCLPKGATRATLRDSASNRLRLRAGDVLLFEEVKGSDTGLEADADPTHRHAVRLTRVYPEATIVDVDGSRSAAAIAYDPLTEGDPDLTPQPIVEIEWHADDALPFAFCLSAVVDGGEFADLSVARGNIVLADHGWTIADPAALSPALVPESGRYRPELRQGNITQAVPFDPESAATQGAGSTIAAASGTALPAIVLDGDGEIWTSQRDLLASDRFTNDFVLETEDDGNAWLRFGDDTLGRRPSAGTGFAATYRVGNGRDGNVGAGAIAHIMIEQASITGVRNPLPAVGGTDPEPIERVRLYAPQAFRRQERAVLVTDYADVAERHPEVQKAQATLRWTGSWHTIYITLDRKEGLAVDDAFKEEMIDFLDRYRMIDRDLEINGPSFIPLDISLGVCLEPGYYASPVKAALVKLFSNRPLADGTLGYFHPDNLTFNQPVYLSKIVALATKVPGVKWVTVDRFKRWGQPDRGEKDAGVIEIGRLEIARLDNDPSAPENGKIEFIMKGGL
jgi:hypothetical protein